MNIKKIIRRYKYLVYIVIGLIGGILLWIAISFMTSKDLVGTSENVQYDVLIGIGCSIISTAVTTGILLALLPDENEKDNLEEWGLLNIHSERQHAKITEAELPKRHLDFIAFGLKHFRDAHKDNTIEKRIRRGLNVRIITLFPDSKFVSERERLENEAGLKSDIKNLIQWVEKIQANINQSKGSIQIKFYDSIPLDFYCHADNRIFVGPYMPGESSGRVITYEFDEDEKGGKYYSDIFEDLWTEKKKIHFLDKNIPYYIGSQKEGVENVLRYFCDQMKGTDGQDVIGVVVMFKADSRRTIFSCNKKQERNHCYSKNAGAVGRLIEHDFTTFIDDTLAAELTVLRHSLLFWILCCFRYFSRKWHKIPAGEFVR